MDPKDVTIACLHERLAVATEALQAIKREVGTSTLAHKLASEALSNIEKRN